MHISFGRDGHLRYDESHAVLICLECKYAVQKSAVESHLLRHKVYRGERRTLLASIAQLHLAEPDQVVPPPNPPAPIDGLAVIPGYRCAADGCGALCASSKRMRRHWSEAHGTTEGTLSSLAEEVHLQTFFRGTKLRYFQVAADSNTNGRERFSVDEARQSPAADRGDDGGNTQPQPTHSPLHLDMEALLYFHHFSTVTSHTLPIRRDRGKTYWQNEVVSSSLQLRWLMCAALAVAGVHISSLASDEQVRRIYCEKAAQLHTEFLSAWPSQPGAVDNSTIEAGAQLECIWRLCQITWFSLPNSGRDLERLDWKTLSRAIRGCLDPSIAIFATSNSQSVSAHYTPPGAQSTPAEAMAATVPNNAPPSVLKSLRELPFRMAIALSKPDSQADLMSVVSAIDVLTNCYIISYADDNDGGKAAWLGMETWLREVPEHFNGMLARQAPAALIVLAHWCVLVKRTESYFWFMKGLEEKVVRGILKQVPEDAAILELVRSCQAALL